MKKQKIIDEVDWILTEEVKNDKRLNPIDKNVLAVLQFVANEKVHTDGWFILPLKKNSTNTTSLVEYLEEFGIKCTYMTVFRTVTKLQYAGYIEYCKGFYNKIERYGIFPRIRILKGTVSCNRKTYNGVINYDTSDYNDIVIVSEENKTNCKPNTCNDIVIVSENTPENDKKTNTSVSDSYSDIVIEDIDIDIDIDNDIETDNNKLEIKKRYNAISSTFYDDTFSNEKVNITVGKNGYNSDFSSSIDVEEVKTPDVKPNGEQWYKVLDKAVESHSVVDSVTGDRLRKRVNEKLSSIGRMVEEGDMTVEDSLKHFKRVRGWLRATYGDGKRWETVCENVTNSYMVSVMKTGQGDLKAFSRELEKEEKDYLQSSVTVTQNPPHFNTAAGSADYVTSPKA